MSKGPEKTLLQRGHSDSQQPYEKKFNVTNHQRNGRHMEGFQWGGGREE